MEALYKNLFPGMLELACDVEQVVLALRHVNVKKIIIIILQIKLSIF